MIKLKIRDRICDADLTRTDHVTGIFSRLQIEQMAHVREDGLGTVTSF